MCSNHGNQPGLREKYGYVVCGNALTCEVQFAYRIAPFFYDGPNGRRRGVIRQIPVDQAPVPVLVRDGNQRLMPIDREDVAPLPVTNDVLEIPRWVQRIDHLMTGTDQSEEEQAEPPSPKEEDSQRNTHGSEEPPQQQTLF